MARRASSGISPGLLIGIAIFVVAAFFGGKALLGKKAESFYDTSPLENRDMREKRNTRPGHQYGREGVRDEKQRGTPDRGQVISLKVDTPAGDEFVGVEIPPDFSKVNIEREKRYSIKVKFRQGGIPVATGINRL